MKFNFKHIILSLLPFGALGLVGCVGDEALCPEDPKQDILTGEAVTVGYMSMRLETTFEEGTRADFTYGSDSDVALAPGYHHFAVVYGDDKSSPLVIAKLTTLAKNDSEQEEHNNWNVAFAELFSKAYPEVRDEEEAKEYFFRFKDCLVILNTNLEEEDLWNLSMDEFLRMENTEPYIVVNNNIYLTMCNSTYIDDSGSVSVSSVIQPEKVYKDRIEALQEAYKGNAAVTVYVERLAAKFNFEFEDTRADNIYQATREEDRRINLFTGFDSNGLPTYDTEHYSYKVKFTGWEMNAQEKNSYLFKKVNAAGNYFTNWFDTEHYRTYWSEDPDYSDTNYPVQYRPAYDKAGLDFYQDFENRDRNFLRNFSYYEIEEASKNFGRDKIFTLENTYDFKNSTLLSNYGKRLDLLAGTHLLITAELLTNFRDGSSYQPLDVYRDENGNFYLTEKECFKALVVAFNNVLASQRTMKFNSYNWTTLGGTVWRALSEIDVEGGNYALYYNGKELTADYIDSLPDNLLYTVEAEIEGGDGKRLIWLPGMILRDENGVEARIIDYIESRPQSATDLKHYRNTPYTDDELKSLMLEWIGPIDHFQDGKMYYAVPVDHTDNICGVVRNHSYLFSLKSVNSIGTPVDNPYQPILPETVLTQDEVEFKVNVLGWHELETDAGNMIK